MKVQLPKPIAKYFAADQGDASIRGAASDLVLVQYGRISLDPFEFAGDLTHIERLVAWDPTA